MLSDIYYGKLTEQSKFNWHNIKDPFNLFEWKEPINIGGLDFIVAEKNNFTDKIQPDWGSYAWKCRKSALVEFCINHNVPCEKIEQLDDNEEYGIVFIEGV